VVRREEVEFDELEGFVSSCSLIEIIVFITSPTAACVMGGLNLWSPFPTLMVWVC